MDKLFKKIVNCETGEEITREFNKEEYAQYKADEKISATRQAESEAKAIAKAAILDRIGLTADELKTILG
jgi:hypothetical protein